MEIAIGKIMSIWQEGTVTEYSDEFRFLFNQVKNSEEISEYYAIYLFMNGLKPEIRDVFITWHQYSCIKVEDVISLALKIDSNGLQDSFSPFDPNSSFYNKDLEFDINIPLNELMKDNELFRIGMIQEMCDSIVQETIVEEVIDDDVQEKTSEFGVHIIDKVVVESHGGSVIDVKESLKGDVGYELEKLLNLEQYSEGFSGSNYPKQTSNPTIPYDNEDGLMCKVIIPIEPTPKLSDESLEEFYNEIDVGMGDESKKNGMDDGNMRAKFEVVYQEIIKKKNLVFVFLPDETNLDQELQLSFKFWTDTGWVRSRECKRVWLLLLRQMHSKMLQLRAITNTLHLDVLKSFVSSLSEVVEMKGIIRGTNEEVHGGQLYVNKTSGGNKNIISDVKSLQNSMTEKKYSRCLKMLLHESAHWSYGEACHYFKIKLWCVPVNKTIMLIVGSAPNFRHEVIGPIKESGGLAHSYWVGLHVNISLGVVFRWPFSQKLRYSIPPFDLFVQGVTPILADLQKYGSASKAIAVANNQPVDLKYVAIWGDETETWVNNRVYSVDLGQGKAVYIRQEIIREQFFFFREAFGKNVALYFAAYTTNLVVGNQKSNHMYTTELRAAIIEIYVQWNCFFQQDIKFRKWLKGYCYMDGQKSTTKDVKVSNWISVVIINYKGEGTVGEMVELWSHGWTVEQSNSRSKEKQFGFDTFD